MQTLGSVPFVPMLRRLYSNTDHSVMRELGSVPLVFILRRLDCNVDTWLCPFCAHVKEDIQ